MSKSKNAKRGGNNSSFGKKVQGQVQNGVFVYNGVLTLDQLCKKTGISRPIQSRSS